MQRIPITKQTMPDKHWLMYRNDDGVIKYLDLAGCANNFSHATGYASEDNLRVVGWHYEEKGLLCYELFNIGHIVLFVSMKPNPIKRIVCQLRGQDPKEAHKEYLGAFEAALNQGGWKTIERSGYIHRD